MLNNNVYSEIQYKKEKKSQDFAFWKKSRFKLSIE